MGSSSSSSPRQNNEDRRRLRQLGFGVSPARGCGGGSSNRISGKNSSSGSKKTLKSNGINKYGRTMHHQQQQHRRLDGIAKSDRALKIGSSITTTACQARRGPRRWHRRQRKNLGLDKILPEREPKPSD